MRRWRARLGLNAVAAALVAVVALAVGWSAAQMPDWLPILLVVAGLVLAAAVAGLLAFRPLASRPLASRPLASRPGRRGGQP